MANEIQAQTISSDIVVTKTSENEFLIEIQNLGSPGVGTPTGGTTGQALIKDSNDNYDTEWGNHNDIAGKQGGTTAEYYHITSAQHTVVGNTSGTNTGDEVVATGAEVNTGTDNDKMVTPKAIADSKVILADKTITGDVLMGENTSLVLDAALSADGKYSGITKTGTAGAALAFGNLCYLDPTDSKWEKTDANAVAAADGDARGVLGMCVLAAAEDAATKMLLWGNIRADAVFPALTIGGQVYVSETAGEIVTAMPTTADVVIRVVGIGLTADELLFCPSADYITHT